MNIQDSAERVVIQRPFWAQTGELYGIFRVKTNLGVHCLQSYFHFT